MEVRGALLRVQRTEDHAVTSVGSLDMSVGNVPTRRGNGATIVHKVTVAAVLEMNRAMCRCKSLGLMGCKLAAIKVIVISDGGLDGTGQAGGSVMTFNQSNHGCFYSDLAIGRIGKIEGVCWRLTYGRYLPRRSSFIPLLLYNSNIDPLVICMVLGVRSTL